MLLKQTDKRNISIGIVLFILLLVTAMLSACARSDAPENVTTDAALVTDSVADSTDVEPDITDTQAITTEETGEDSEKTESETTSGGDTETETDPVDESASETETETETDTETEVETRVPPEETPREILPYIDIYTEDGQAITSKEEYVRATISVGDCADEYVMFDCPAQIRVRGNTTGARPKKPYRIKFDTKQSLLGLNGGEQFKNWCLLADYYDLTMLRTWSAFSFANVLLEDKYYSSDCTQVEVYLNDRYMGVYLLCEQTQIDDDRVDIYEKRDDETSVEIGYLMIGQGGRTDEPDTVSMYPNFWVTDRNGNQMYFDRLNMNLSGSGYTQEQKEYVANYVTSVTRVMYNALYSERYYFIDDNGYVRAYPASELEGMTTEEKQIYTIDAVFNIDAAVRMCVLEEIVKNQDIATFNMYVDLSPRGDRRLTLAAPWDYDFSMANNAGEFLHDFAGRHASAINNNHSNLFYIMLSTTDWFDRMCKELWQEKYDDLIAVMDEILFRTYRYTEAYNRDWRLWGVEDRRELEKFQCFDDLATFEDHTDAGWFLYNWLTFRMRFIDRMWGDGTDKGSAPLQPQLNIDFTQDTAMGYVNSERRCTYEITEDGLYVTVSDEARDPYFYVDYTGLLGTYVAEDYYVLEIEYMIPETNSLDEYRAEFYLCTGDRTFAIADVSVLSSLGVPTGEFCTLRLNLKEMAYPGCWEGKIHKIRFDFFDTCAQGDSIYIRSVKLLPA